MKVTDLLENKTQIVNLTRWGDALADISKVLNLKTRNLTTSRGLMWNALPTFGNNDNFDLSVSTPNDKIDPEDIELTRRAITITLKKHFRAVEFKGADIYAARTMFEYEVVP